MTNPQLIFKNKHIQENIIMAENIDYDFIFKLLGIIGGAIGLIRFLDYHYKGKLSKDTKQATNTHDIDHLQDQFNSLSKELTNHKSDIYSKISRHEEFADEMIRELKGDIIKIIKDMSYMAGKIDASNEREDKK